MQPGSPAPMAEPSCKLSATWSSPASVPGIPAFATQPFVAMTSDELTVAWVLGTGGGASVFVADRASTADAFGSAQLVSSGGGADDAGTDAAPAPDGAQPESPYFAFDRVALGSDGLTMVGVSVSGLQMAQFLRDERGAAFSAVALPTRYESLGNVLMPGQRLGDPVLSADGDDLVYSLYGQSAGVTIYESFQFGTNAWPPGSPQSAVSLAITAGTRMRPTSLSADRLTLFYWDEASNTAYAVFRNVATDQFGAFTKAYGPFFSVQANTACSRLYYVAPGPTGFALVEVDAE